MADLIFNNVTTACTGISISTPTSTKTYLQYISGLLSQQWKDLQTQSR